MSKDENKCFLFISNYPLDSNSSAAIRNRAIIEGFILNGYNAYTLTKKPSTKVDLNNVEQYYFKNKSIAYKVARSIKEDKESLIWKLRTVIAKMIASVRIYDNQRILLKHLDEIDINTRKFDFVISSSDSKVSHVIAEHLFKSGHIESSCWIQYWGDPFYTDINKTSIVPSLLIKNEEERLIRLADYILYTSPFTLAQQKELFPKHSDKMYYIPTPYINKRVYKPTNNQKVIIGYYGSYFKKDRDIMPLYSAALKLKNIDFQFIGVTDIKLSQKENIEIHWQVPYEEILQYEAKCDVLICLANRAESSQIPGKLYHYAATNKPILFIYEKDRKDIAEYFMQFDRYNVCENSEYEIMNKINEIVNGSGVKPIPVEDFYCKEVANQILKIISDQGDFNNED